MKHLKRFAATLALASVCLSTAAPVAAFGSDGGAGYQILAKIKLLYEKTVEALKEAKHQSEKLRAVQDELEQARVSAEAVRNMDIKDAAHSYVSKLISGDERQEKIRDLDEFIEVLDEKALKTGDEEERRKVLERRDFYQDLRTRHSELLSLEHNTAETLAKTAYDLSQRDSARITAQNLSVLSKLELERETEAQAEREAEREAAEVEKDLVEMNLEMKQRATNSGW